MERLRRRRAEYGIRRPVKRVSSLAFKDFEEVSGIYQTLLASLAFFGFIDQL